MDSNWIDDLSVRRDIARARTAGKWARPCHQTLLAFTALAAAFVIAATAASAQTVITDQPTRDLATSKQAQQATETSLNLNSTGDFEPVTYAEVLKDPDNIELGFRFARTQVRAGALHGAVSTLERILF